MRKKAVLLALLGYIGGCLIGVFFALQGSEFNLAKSLPDILLGGLPGAIAMGTVVIYDVEKWSILRATFTHFLVAMGVMVLACFVLKWFEPGSPAFWIMLGAELVAYFLIWLIMYLGYRGKVRKLNELLKQNRDADPQ